MFLNVMFNVLKPESKRCCAFVPVSQLPYRNRKVSKLRCLHPILYCSCLLLPVSAGQKLALAQLQTPSRTLECKIFIEQFALTRVHHCLRTIINIVRKKAR